MYRVGEPDKTVVNKFYNDYHQAIEDGIDFFLAGGQITKSIKQGKTMRRVTFEVQNGGETELFLNQLKTAGQLELLMKAAPEELVDWIFRVEKLFKKKKKEAFNRLTIKYHNNHYSGKTVVDHFYTIIHEIFVERVFDGKIKSKPVFDKKEFCEKLNLVLCPYCGREDIAPHLISTKKGTTYVKPDIDHFLPKGRYPFLAMSFYNLIPAGAMCNKSRKSTYNPLASVAPVTYRILNPYRFDALAFTFFYENATAHYMNEKAYKIMIDFKGDKYLRQGYSKRLGMERSYSKNKNMLVDLYTQMGGLSNYYLNDLRSLGVKGDEMFYRLVLGYSINDVESRRQYFYKFRLDVATQMYSDSGCKWPW